MHYHGTPITPNARLLELAGRNFCVSYVAPAQVETCHRIGQSVMLDNGAYSKWRKGAPTDWPGYYAWCERWLEFPTTWAVIPDVIDGTEDENDRLVREWPHGHRGAPVWHMHESFERLEILVFFWERVCIGSSGQYAVVGTPQWHRRMEAVFNLLCPDRAPTTWLHMLRGMALCEGPYPFASADSTDIGRNHNPIPSRDKPQQSVVAMADRWDSKQTPARWAFREQLEMADV